MRWLRYFLVYSLLLVGAVPQRATGDVENPATSFAASYNEWIMINQSRTSGVINAKELAAWNRTKAAWKVLQRVNDASY